MTSSYERNDRRSRFEPRLDASGPHGQHRRRTRPPLDTGEWVWGRHAVLAALSNPARQPIKRLLVSPEAARTLPAGAAPEILSPAEIAQALPPGAVHQGLALAAAPLEAVGLEELADPAQGVLVMLDQVTDPQNVGAILRSAAAFGARGVILQDRHAPSFTGALAKAAAGALETVPVARVVNLARALESLSDLGWRAIGLAGEAEGALEQVLDGAPTVLVLGSEGAGLRRLVGEHCDALARIPMPGGFESLNVSAAAAVALYEAARVTRALASGE